MCRDVCVIPTNDAPFCQQHNTTCLARTACQYRPFDIVIGVQELDYHYFVPSLVGCDGESVLSANEGPCDIGCHDSRRRLSGIWCLPGREADKQKFLEGLVFCFCLPPVWPTEGYGELIGLAARSGCILSSLQIDVGDSGRQKLFMPARDLDEVIRACVPSPRSRSNLNRICDRPLNLKVQSYCPRSWCLRNVSTLPVFATDSEIHLMEKTHRHSRLNDLTTRLGMDFSNLEPLGPRPMS